MAVTTPSVPASGTAVQNTTGQNVDVTVTGGTITGIKVDYPTGQAPAVSTPAVPASTVTATNTNSFPVAVAVTGGTVTVIAVNGTTQFTATGNTAIVPAGGTIALTYSVAPTWTWTAVWAGFSGTSIPSPSSVPLPAMGFVTLTYSVAPTWAWADPLDLSPDPGPAQENLGPYNEETDEPEPAHTEGGESGLGVGVEN
jgi:hypothetical protein